MAGEYVRLVPIGDGRVGKTCLTTALDINVFDERPPYRTSICEQRINVDDKIVHLIIDDGSSLVNKINVL